MTHYLHLPRVSGFGIRRLGLGLIIVAICIIALFQHGAVADEITRRADVDASPAAVWSVIGPFCSIAEWHPVVGSCSLDGKTPPTRTFATKDGKLTFVEPEIARDDVRHSYSYAFVGKPFPVSNYNGTISVLPKGKSAATVVWHGVYTPDEGKAKEAQASFAAVYEAGLKGIQAKFAN